MLHSTFADILMTWYSTNHRRSLPWKSSKDPYPIWISEIILQQTRVEQGIPYFLRFMERFPDIQSLAESHEDEVMKLWQGLGYYSRARNLHFTAKYVWSELNGCFPSTYAEILKLKGIGPYTAAAIASFAFDERYPVVDGNVLRLISRILGMIEPVDSTFVSRQIYDFVHQAISSVDPADFNQALMDFGASQCKPALPLCPHCPFIFYCQAYQKKAVDSIPYKSKKTARKSRYFHYLVTELPNAMTILHQRTGTDIWKKLFQFPMIETNSFENPSKNLITDALLNIGLDIREVNMEVVKVYESRQLLTHRIIYGYFFSLQLDINDVKINKDHYLVEREKVSNFAFPKMIADFIDSSSFLTK